MVNNYQMTLEWCDDPGPGHLLHPLLVGESGCPGGKGFPETKNMVVQLLKTKDERANAK